MSASHVLLVEVFPLGHRKIGQSQPPRPTFRLHNGLIRAAGGRVEPVVSIVPSAVANQEEKDAAFVDPCLKGIPVESPSF